MDFDPDNKDLIKRAMILTMGAGETNRAISYARSILETEPDNVLALLFMTEESFARQDYKQAVTRLSAMPDGSMAEFIRPLLIAWAHAGQGQFNQKDLIEAASPLHAYHALLIGDYLGKLPKGFEGNIKNILETGTIDVYELERIADILARRGFPKQALSFYQAIQAEQPSREDITARIARLEKNEPIGDLALKTQIHSPEEGAAEALFDMARILFREYSDDSSIVFARMAVQLDPSLLEAQLLLASILTRHERIDEAIAIYNAMPDTSTFYVDARRQAAELLENNGRSDEAVTVLETLYKKNNDINSLIMIGDIQRRQENFEDAIKTYNKAEKVIGQPVDKKYWPLFYARGMAYERLNDMPHAERDLKEALKFEPDHPYLLNYLGYSWVDRGKNLEESLKLIQKAVSLRPDDGYIADSLGWTYYKMGNFKDAVKTLETAVELVPYDSTINDHLGDAYWRVGRHMEARFAWMRAKNHSTDDDLTAQIDTKLSQGLGAIPAPTVKQAKNLDGKGTVKQ